MTKLGSISSKKKFMLKKLGFPSVKCFHRFYLYIYLTLLVKTNSRFPSFSKPHR